MLVYSDTSHDAFETHAISGKPRISSARPWNLGPYSKHYVPSCIGSSCCSCVVCLKGVQTVVSPNTPSQRAWALLLVQGDEATTPEQTTFVPLFAFEHIFLFFVPPPFFFFPLGASERPNPDTAAPPQQRPAPSLLVRERVLISFQRPTLQALTTHKRFPIPISMIVLSVELFTEMQVVETIVNPPHDSSGDAGCRNDRQPTQ